MHSIKLISNNKFHIYLCSNINFNIYDWILLINRERRPRTRKLSSYHMSASLGSFVNCIVVIFSWSILLSEIQKVLKLSIEVSFISVGRQVFEASSKNTACVCINLRSKLTYLFSLEGKLTCMINYVTPTKPLWTSASSKYLLIHVIKALLSSKFVSKFEM